MVKISTQLVFAALVATPALAAPLWTPQNRFEVTARGLDSEQSKSSEPKSTGQQMRPPKRKASGSSASTQKRSRVPNSYSPTPDIQPIELRPSQEISLKLPDSLRLTPSSPVVPNPVAVSQSSRTAQGSRAGQSISQRRYMPYPPSDGSEDFEDRGPTFSHPDVERVWLKNPEWVPPGLGTASRQPLSDHYLPSGKRARESVTKFVPYRGPGGSSSSSTPGVRRRPS